MQVKRIFMAAMLVGALSVCGMGAASKQSIPTAAEIKDATEDVRAPFQKEFADPTAAAKLAATLLDQLPRLKKPALQYVCCTDAYDQAKKAGDAALAMRAVEALNLRFDNAETLPMAMVVLTPLAQKPPPADACVGLLQQAAEVYLRVLALDDKQGHDAVEKLVPLMRSLAAKTKPPSTLSLVELLKEGNQFIRKRGLGNQALQRAKAAPDDAAANEVAGQWLCFTSRRWEEGLPYLGRSENLELKKLASLEISASDAKAELEVAKQWAILPEKLGLDALSIANARSHARELCARVALGAAGFTRDDAATSLERITLIGGAGVTVAPAVAKVHTKRIGRLAFTPDSSTLFSLSTDGVIVSWDVASASVIARGRPDNHFSGDEIIPLPNSKFVLAGNVHVLARTDLNTDVYITDGNLPGVEFSKDGRVLLGGVGGNIGTVSMEKPTQKDKVISTRKLPGPVRGIAFSPDEKLIVCGCADQVSAFEASNATDTPLWTTDVGGRAWRLHFAPDGKSVWAFGGSNVTQLDLGTGAVLNSFPHLDSSTRNLPEVSPDAAWFLGWNDKTKSIELWDVAAKKATAHFGGADVTWVCWLPDSRRFLWAEGLELHLSDVSREGDVTSFDTGKASITRIAVTPDGKWAATGSAEGDVRFWPMPVIRAGK